MIKAGTEIRDADGNLLVTVVNDLINGDVVVSPKNFRLPDGSHPFSGEPIPTAVVEYLERHLPR